MVSLAVAATVLQTTFLIFTRENAEVPVNVSFGDVRTAQLRDAVDPSRPLKIIIHGFFSGCQYQWLKDMRSKLLIKENATVICVDWSAASGAELDEYTGAVENSRHIGKAIAELLLNAFSDNTTYPELRPDDHAVHLIGHSLGAHVAGTAASEYKEKAQSPVSVRISGLDPARPLFERMPASSRLDASDADFVDIVHTDAGGLGMNDAIGHVDFFVNGGSEQPGCQALDFSCEHDRSKDLFIESILSECLFVAVPCTKECINSLVNNREDKKIGGFGKKELNRLGYPASPNRQLGILFVKTTSKSPFCGEQYQMKIKFSAASEQKESQRTSRGLLKTYRNETLGNLIVRLENRWGTSSPTQVTVSEKDVLEAGESKEAPLMGRFNSGLVHRLVLEYEAYTDEGPVQSYEGAPEWALDSISLKDLDGNKYSFCHRGLKLESGQPISLPLSTGDCTDPTSTVKRQSVTMTGRKRKSRMFGAALV